MNALQCEDFFSQITTAFVYESGFYEYFIRHGFDPREWPDVQAKPLAVKFHTFAETNSIDYARLYLSKEVKPIEKIYIPGKTHPVPATNLEIPWDDGGALIVMFHEFKKYATHYQLGVRLMEQAQNGEEILSRFKNNPTSLAESLHLQERLAVHIDGHIEKTKSGAETKVIIQDWKLLSELIGGFNAKRISMLVAGTGVGKTTLAINILLSAIKTIPALYINMEMGEEDILDRICMIGSGTTSQEWEVMDSGTRTRSAKFISTAYRNSPMYYTDGQSLTIEQISNRIYFHAETHGVKLVFVDYDQKIRTKFRGEEWQAIQKAVEELEGVAKQSKVHICVLAQGDESNQPRASKRSTQPASSVLAFYKNEVGDYVIEAKKNRFGPRDEKIKVICDFSQYLITEAGQYQDMPRAIDRSIFKGYPNK